MTEARKKLFLAQSLSKCKSDAWKIFSEWIRRRFANDQGIVPCCSCGRAYFWKEGDAGHWPSIDGRNNSILFEERGCHFQCKQCNVFRHGNPAGYDAYMRKHYGEKVMADLIKLKRKTVIYSKQDLILMIDGWMAKLAALDRK